MTTRSDLKILGSRCREWLHLSLPKGNRIKAVAGILGQGDDTAERMTRGEAPTVAQLLSFRRHFGMDFIEYVFGDLVSDERMAADAARVAAFMADLRRGKETDAAEALRGRAAQGDAGAHRHVQPKPGLAGAAAVWGPAATLTSERLPLDRLRFHQPLREHLDRFRSHLGRLEPSEVVSLARADSTGRTGVVLHRIGDVHRYAYRPRAGTLIAPSERIIGRPVTEGSTPDYGHLVEKTCLEAETSAEPVLARLRGRVLRSDGRVVASDVAVLRTVYRSRRGAASIVSTFVPVAA